MNNIDQIGRILKDNNLSFGKTDEVRLILGQSPYPDTSKRTIMNSNYPFSVAAFVTPSFEETIQLFCVMNLFFGLDNAKILINEFKKNNISGQEFVCYLGRNFKVFLGNVSEKSKVSNFLTNHKNVKILCCGRASQKFITKFNTNNVNFKIQKFDIVYPGSFNFRNSSTVKQWLLFNHQKSQGVKNEFSLL
ncbi:hypothetical protein B9W73_09990 [Lactococcus lactis]|uniref:hypothetical protein n=1 Tax=Lactococcus lactis TaxID=1358 RepID=UPI000A1E9452|nr:hypothetical protein [Lactococcus lactis]OSP86479.1 hypothetical protein B9W73_09990 [Lactococcus lactis]